MPKIEVAPGVALHCDERGAAGPVVVLLNGMSQSTANWLTQSRHLSEHFRVVAYDARGQGRSDLGTEPLSLDVHCRDLMALLKALGVERAHLCGFSYGARIALAMAARHPEVVDRLVLTSLGAGQDALRRTIVRSWLETLNRGGLEAMAWCSLPSILGARFLGRYEAQLDGMILATTRRNSEPALRALLESLTKFPRPEEDAPKVLAPTLVLGSSRDPLVPLEGTLAITGLFADARHQIFDDCAHTIPVESPETWRQAVMTFLRG
mgnify:CR=1 FL=1